MTDELGLFALTCIVLIDGVVLLRLGRWSLRLWRLTRRASAITVAVFSALIVALGAATATGSQAATYEPLFELWFLHWVYWAFLWLLAAPFLLMVRALESAGDLNA